MDKLKDQRRFKLWKEGRRRMIERKEVKRVIEVLKSSIFKLKKGLTWETLYQTKGLLKKEPHCSFV